MPDEIPRKDRTASLMLEKKLFDAGTRHVYGIDEAGRGPIAGPLVAAAVCLPLDRHAELPTLLKGVKDSKKMTRRQREAAVDVIKAIALAWGIGEVTPQEMPDIGNMTKVTFLAMERALKAAQAQSDIAAEHLLVDYYQVPFFDATRQDGIKQGDTHSLSIAAASVLAKTHRDAYMHAIAADYPQYNFEQHKGYGTPAHLAALREYGACPLHRQNYKSVRQAKRLWD